MVQLLVRNHLVFILTEVAHLHEWHWIRPIRLNIGSALLHRVHLVIVHSFFLLLKPPIWERLLV